MNDWTIILKDSADLLKKHALKGAKLTVSELYDMLSASYKREYKQIPSKTSFQDHLRKELNIEKPNRLSKEVLQQLISNYSSIDLSTIANNLSIKYKTPSLECNWIIIKVEKKPKSTIDLNKLLYSLSKKLKDKYPKLIDFITFDIDSVIIFVSSEEKKRKLIDKLNLCKIQESEDK